MKKIIKTTKTSVKVLLVIILAFSLSLTACSKRNQFDELNDKIIVLFQQGKYLEAEELAQEALELIKEKFGQNHLQVATSLDTLALIYYTQGKYQQTEPLYKEALSIKENILGKNHPDLIHLLDNMSKFYRTIGNEAEAQEIEKRIARIHSSK